MELQNPNDWLFAFLKVIGVCVAIYIVARVASYGVMKSINDSKKRFTKKGE